MYFTFLLSDLFLMPVVNSIDMRRTVIYFILISFCVCQTNCVRYVDPPVSETQARLMSKSWYLSYTDSGSVDSLNMYHLYRIPANECEKKEALKFNTDGKYSMDLFCNQARPGNMEGIWGYFQDSSISYGLKSDTGVLGQSNTARIIFITTDSLQLTQSSNFASPDSTYKNFFQLKTYSH